MNFQLGKAQPNMYTPIETWQHTQDFRLYICNRLEKTTSIQQVHTISPYVIEWCVRYRKLKITKAYLFYIL